MEAWRGIEYVCFVVLRFAVARFECTRRSRGVLSERYVEDVNLLVSAQSGALWQFLVVVTRSPSVVANEFRNQN